MSKIILLLVISLTCALGTVMDNEVSVVKKYEPNWDSLDSRPLPTWFDDAKIGIFLHWGVYAVPSYGTEWFWYYWKGAEKPDYVEFMNKNYPPGFTYQDFGRDFKVELFDPNQWAELFQASGARYVVLTSKHHDGYCMWPSDYSFSWNSQDVGAHRDLVGDLAQAVRNKTDLRFGLYHSLFEWFNPLHALDKANNWTTQYYVKTKSSPALYELINRYKPSVLWSDGEADNTEEYWDSLNFLAWLYNDSPVKDEVVTNDRWGKDTHCKHGDFYSCADRYNPGTLQPHKWENAMTLDKISWGYRRDAKLSDYMTTKQLLVELAQTVSCGGNILINVGPTKEGTIDVIFEERLRELGTWLKVNGKAVYESRPWVHQNDTLTPGVWFTKPKDPDSGTVFALFYDWPTNDVLEIEVLHKYLDASGTIHLLGNEEKLQWYTTDNAVNIVLPGRTPVKDAWVLQINLKCKCKKNVA